MMASTLSILNAHVNAPHPSCLSGCAVVSEGMAIGDRIVEALKDRKGDGITRSDLARACGVKPASVSQWISGSTKSIRQDHLVKAADFLGVNIRWLAVGEGPKKLDHKEVWLDIGGLSPERQAALRALLGTLEDGADSGRRQGNGH